MPPEKLSPEIEKLIKDQPVLVMMSLLTLDLLLQAPKVPGLGVRRNTAWRGKGSFGKAPFGKQVGHRR